MTMLKRLYLAGGGVQILLSRSRYSLLKLRIMSKLSKIKKHKLKKRSSLGEKK